MTLPSFIREHVSLATYASNRTGGPARYFAEPSTEDEVHTLFAFIRSEKLPWFPLGGGTNTLICTDGFPGVVVRLAMKSVRVEGQMVHAEAGATFAVAALAAAKAGLTGLEFGAVIPGTVGGAVYGNAGAHGRETKDALKTVRFYDPATDSVEEKPKEELGLTYRHSIFKEHPALLLSATFVLASAPKEEINARINTYRKHREETQPLSQPNTGCVFKNPPGDYAGRLVEAAGLKGYTVGGAQVSSLHANFLVNLGTATAEDMAAVRKHVKKTVQERFGITLEEENILLEPSGGNRPNPSVKA